MNIDKIIKRLERVEKIAAFTLAKERSEEKSKQLESAKPKTKMKDMR